MDSDALWRTIDGQRAALADLLDGLTDEEWSTPSLCIGWTIRDVAAHLTLAQMGLLPALLELARARGSFDRMIRDSAIRQARLPAEEFPRRLRAMAGSRRTAPGITELEPLIDILVHFQDVVRPLGRTQATPAGAAAVAASRVWSMGFPFRARRRLAGFRLVATDTDWFAGSGEVIEGPIGALLLLVTGRDAALHELTGPGAEQLRGLRS